MSNYAQLYRESIESPEAFWGEQAKQLSWFKPPQTVLTQDEHGMARWFSDGEMNTSYMALDAQVAQGRGEQVAIYYDSPVTRQKEAISYQALLARVAEFAGALRALGVAKGDRVLIYMPMVPEAAIAMLAVARLGAVHSVVFGGFAARELAVRIDDACPKVIVSASCGIEVDRVIPYKPLLDDAIELATHAVDHCVVLQRRLQTAPLSSPRDLSWDEAIKDVEPADAVPVLGTDPLYILYTSGTTGKPKGVLRDNAGHAVAMRYSMKTIYNMDPGDVFWAASDVGWVVGHSYIVYAPLLSGLSTVLYEGKPIKTPDAGAFWRVVEEYRVRALFSAPTAFRAIKKEDPEGHLFELFNTKSLETIFVAGERLDPPTCHWLESVCKVPIIDHWWQTETGWAICANPVGIERLPVKVGSATQPSPGFEVAILNEDGQACGPNEQGAVAVKLPMPPGCLPGLWQDDERFRSSYLTQYPGYYCSGDGGYIDEDGYVFIMGRTDDVINVSGHRLSTGEMEEIVASHDAVAECAVIGIHCALKGQVPVGFVLLKDGESLSEETLEADLVALVREKIGALACFKQVLLVNRLPKTRSGKILRKLMRQMADGESYGMPSTIDDPASIEELEAHMRRREIGSFSRAVA